MIVKLIAGSILCLVLVTWVTLGLTLAIVGWFHSVYMGIAGLVLLFALNRAAIRFERQGKAFMDWLLAEVI